MDSVVYSCRLGCIWGERTGVYTPSHSLGMGWSQDERFHPPKWGFSPAYTPARTQSLASVLNELVPVHARGRIWVYRSGSVDVRSWEGELNEG